MKALLDIRALAIAGAIAGAVITALCFGLYALLGRPDPWMDLFYGSGPTLWGWIVGMGEGAAVSAIAGAILGAAYNRMVRPAAQVR
ncbi:MAG TPA: hypothetical protein VLB49_01830 [Gemmatimonadales bacterium]|nr:hypothetical protein [Gemmatimonadales bacterium]